ncbi:uncharacterized protein LOC133891981 [Phragmites australis]|uniref:uncharacterized protein LOC133891981 n=1 Tax=Phragmites australis TaxID=29695 RepID=UPI002D779E3E|nr:uncharacterized protein LOC133891981 [Phragmites australis]
MSDPRLLPGAAGDGAAAVPVRTAAATVAGVPRGLPRGAVLLLPHRRVLLRPLHHLRQLIKTPKRPKARHGCTNRVVICLCSSWIHFTYVYCLLAAAVPLVRLARLVLLVASGPVPRARLYLSYLTRI